MRVERRSTRADRARERLGDDPLLDLVQMRVVHVHACTRVCDCSNKKHAAPTTPMSAIGRATRNFDDMRLLFNKACGLSAILADLMLEKSARQLPHRRRRGPRPCSSLLSLATDLPVPAGILFRRPGPV
jgi:hypothetical protein